MTRIIAIITNIGYLSLSLIGQAVDFIYTLWPVSVPEVETVS